MNYGIDYFMCNRCVTPKRRQIAFVGYGFESQFKEMLSEYKYKIEETLSFVLDYENNNFLLKLGMQDTFIKFGKYAVLDWLGINKEYLETPAIEHNKITFYFEDIEQYNEILNYLTLYETALPLKTQLLKIIELNGFATDYMGNMLFGIEHFENGNENYEINKNCNLKHLIENIPGLDKTTRWDLEYCAGEYCLNKNKLWIK